MALTKDQQSAVDVRDRTLLVSAAAGSGKTYTLTQRIIKAIIDDRQDLSRLLIVTFTRAAAGELKAKIAKALGDAIAEHPGDAHLQNQMIKLGNAHISTIDSFFADPVRMNFEKLGLPASMRLSDDAELAPIRDAIMQETLDTFFSWCEPYENETLSPVGYSNRYTELIGIITGARDTSKLLPTFWDIYKKLITSPRSLEQLKEHAHRLSENAQMDFFETLEGHALKNELTSTVKYAWKTFVKCSDDMQSDPFVASKYTSDFIDNAALCHTLLSKIESGGYDEVCQAFEEYKPAKITSISSKEKTDKSEYYKDLRSDLNGKIKKLATEYLYKSKEELSSLFSVYSDMCALLYELLSRFEKKYAEEKKRRGICEFSDMPKFMLSLLTDSDGNPTEYAKTLSESFDEVYIDEYQDVNEIQDTIFALIGKKHRFMVGDIKQSIYGFREAEPSIFAEYRRKFPLYDSENDTAPSTEESGNTIFMSENFRCDENIIKFTNTVCSGVFSAFADSIGYTESDDLRFGKGNPTDDYVSPKVNLSIIQTPPDTEDDISDEDSSYQDDASSSSENAKNLGDEAIVVANQIAHILRTEQNADGTPITPGNIAILVRSHAHNKPILNALSALNIKYSLSSKGELFENEDMRLLVNLLSVVDNPRSDMPLCHLLTTSSDVYSPDFTLEEVVKIRRFSDRSKSLYDALIEYSGSGDDKSISSRCASFIAYIEKMRAAAGRISADKLVKSLISSEKYSSLTTTDAYTYLYDSACKFVKNTWSSLYSFIKYFKDVMESGEAGAEPDTKNRDAVTVMSIHQSKGLEFNVCFLFGFGKQFNMQNRYPIIFNKDFGPSMKLPPNVDADADILERLTMRYENNPIYKTVERYNKSKQLEEEARIFYVALTRARERLYISATLSRSYSDYVARLAACADPEYEIKKSRTYINWILLTLLSRDETVYSVNIYDKNMERLTRPFVKSVAASSERDASEDELELASLISLPDSQSDSDRMLSTVPSKVAASKVSSHMLDDSIFSPIPTGKLFSDSDEDANEPSRDTERIIRSRIELMRSSPRDFDSLLEINKKPTTAEIGTATHAFLQFCDYQNTEINGLDREIERLKRERFISERTASIINKKQLEGFFRSDLYRLISSAKTIHREFHFGMFRYASDFTQNDTVKELVKDKKIYVQGSIDLVIEGEDGEIVLCDYKTDRLSPDEKADRELLLSNMKQKHADQLSQYSYAARQIFGKEPKHMYIYSLSLGEAIEIK